MKLFVWNGFSPDYKGGLAFAIAYTIGEAQSMVIDHIGYDPSDWGALEIHPLDTPIARAVSGGG